MARFVSFHARQERQAYKRQVADQVQSFVAAKLVREVQGAVHHPFVGQDNGVFKRPATNQAHGPERLDVALETKSAGPRQQVPEGIRSDEHLHFLLTH